MPFKEISVGNFKDGGGRKAIREGLAEFIATLIFVFAGQGSSMAFRKLRPNGIPTVEGIVAAALAHSFGLMVGVSVSKNISKGHLNPAVTFGAFVGGDKDISLLKLISYWAAQLLGSTAACLLLKIATHGMEIKAFSLAQDVTVWSALVLEIVMTFGLVYTVYATAIDRNNGNLDSIAPIVIGLIVGANILVGGPFDGAAMNPAVAFGPAIVSWTWTSHWVYWVGPLIGAGLAAFTFEAFMTRPALSPPASPDFSSC